MLELCCYSWNAHFVPSRPGNSEVDRGLGMVDSHRDGLFMQGPNEGQGGRGIKILGEMAEWANSSQDKHTQSINNESVTGLDVFAFALAY